MADPLSAAAGGFASGLAGRIFGGNTASPAGPSILDSITDTRLDFSGWTVATGGSKAEATSSKEESGAGFPLWAQLGIGGVLLVVALRMLRK